MHRSLYILLVLMLLGSTTATAQSKRQLLRQGDKAVKDGDHYGAALAYKRALQKDSFDLRILEKYAHALRGYRDYAKAEKAYKRLHDLEIDEYPESLFWLASMKKYRGAYAEAKDDFTRFRKSYQDKASWIARKAKQETKSCDAAILMSKDTANVLIEHLGNEINSYDSEFAPLLVNDSTLYFSALKFPDVGRDNRVKGDPPLIRLHEAKKENGQWSVGQPLDSIINDSVHHVANGSFSPDGSRFYFSKCLDDEGCSIFISHFSGSSWSTPEALPELINLPGFTTTQPMITEVDRKEVLFFVSDRPKGKGGLDIWYTVITRGGKKYGKPRNPGIKVNTKGDDISPFYDRQEQALYFSSDWHPGLGGFDIFQCEGGLRSLKPAKNLGLPINTSVDEYYYSQHSESYQGVFASNRVGSLTKKGETCCNDLYRVKYPEPDVPDTSRQEPVVSFKDLKDYLPITLYFHNDEPNPRSWDTTTSVSYLTAYEQYLDREDEYLNATTSGLTDESKIEKAETELEEFLLDYLEAGVDKLRLAMEILEQELANGSQIELAVKGYASPLAKSDYNLNLTLRRISSLENYLQSYKEGFFLPYLNGQATNGASLKVVRIPYGEEKAAGTVSDVLTDKRSSVYSRSAALERKIEILSISRTLPTSMEFSEPDFEFGSAPDGEVIHHTYSFKNTGPNPLKIQDIQTSCGCTLAEWPQEEIAPGEQGEIKVAFNTKDKAGPQRKLIKVTTNTNPPLSILTIQGEVLPVPN